MLEPHPNNGGASCPPGGDLVKGQSAAGLLVYDDNESLMVTRHHCLVTATCWMMMTLECRNQNQLRPSEATSYGLYNFPG